MVSEGSLPRLQKPATCPYAEPDRSSPYPTSWRSILILSSHLRLGSSKCKPYPIHRKLDLTAQTGTAETVQLLAVNCTPRDELPGGGGVSLSTTTRRWTLRTVNLRYSIGRCLNGSWRQTPGWRIQNMTPHTQTWMQSTTNSYTVLRKITELQIGVTAKLLPRS
jgi:hypothetical protein